MKEQNNEVDIDAEADLINERSCVNISSGYIYILYNIHELR